MRIGHQYTGFRRAFSGFSVIGLVVWLAAGLWGCADAESDTPPLASGQLEATAGGSDDGASVDPALPATPDTVPSGPFLALEGEGLRIFDATTGEARPIPFGTPMADALAVLATLEGGPPAESGENPECGLSYASWVSGLTVTFSSDRFAGWSTRDGDRLLTTASGVGIGSTRREVEAAYAARFVDSSLGVEFSAGSLAGVLDSAAAEGRVIALWAGLVCLAR